MGREPMEKPNLAIVVDSKWLNPEWKKLTFLLVHLKTIQRGKIISSSCFTMKRVTATTEENNDIIYKHKICNLQHFSSWVVAYKTRMIPEFEKPREHFHGEDKQT